MYIDTITSSALKLINNISINKPEINLNCKIEILDFEIFTYKELSFNITKHELQPKNFELLSPIESQKFKKKWGIKMAKMFVTDPICKFYHFSPGSIIKITRKNNYVTHRIVKKNLKK
jgi:DNA-directed RNA polymerase subunit H (RpoH/RPB5)